MTLELEEFESGGSVYIRSKSDKQRYMLSHLLNGAGACCFAEQLDNVITLANAHGWLVTIDTLAAPREDERGIETSSAAPLPRFSGEWFSDFLARALRDGGKYEKEHGTDAACAEVDRRITRLNLLAHDSEELLDDISRDEVNHQDEAEKWLRAYAPHRLFSTPDTKSIEE